MEADFSYVVMDTEGKKQCGYGTNLPKDLHEAIKQRATMVDIVDSQHVYGKLVMINDPFAVQKQRVQRVVMLTSLLELLIFILYYVYLQKTIIKPFQDLQTFAKHIAQGDLNHPLPMDQSHVFGAFSESFDMMLSLIHIYLSQHLPQRILFLFFHSTSKIQDAAVTWK